MDRYVGNGRQLTSACMEHQGKTWGGGGSLIVLWQVVWHMRYWWHRRMAVAMNRASTTHLPVLTHKHTLTHVNTCTRNRGLIESVKPACRSCGDVFDSCDWQSKQCWEKKHINTRRLRRDRNTHPDMYWAKCVPDSWKDTCTYAKGAQTHIQFLLCCSGMYLIHFKHIRREQS